MDVGGKIYVAGHSGLFGSALMRALEWRVMKNIVTASHAELDLTDGEATRLFSSGKSRIASLPRRQRWEASRRITPIWRILPWRIC